MEKEKNNMNLLQLFTQRQQARSKILIKGNLQAILDYLQYIIHTQFDKHSKNSYKVKNRKSQLDQNYINAINSMNRQQKVRYYDTFVQYIVNQDQNKLDPPLVEKTTLSLQAFTRSYNLKIWKKKKIRLDQQRHVFFAQKADIIKQYNLGYYLLRQSKNKDYHCFVMEAINGIPHETARTVHVGFTDPNRYLQWYKAIKQSIQYKKWEFVLKSTGKINMSPVKLNSRVTESAMKVQSKPNQIQQNEMKFSGFSYQGQKPQHDLSSDQQSQRTSPKFAQQKNHQFQSPNSEKSGKRKTEQIKQQSIMTEQKKLKQQENKFTNMNVVNMTSGHTIVDSLMQSDNDEQMDNIQQKDKVFVIQKKHLDLFHKMMPDYELEDLQSEQGYTTILNQSNFRVSQHNQIKKKLKVFISFNEEYKKQVIFSVIANTEYITKYNDSIQQLSIKTMIGSQNSAIIYQKNKQYNKLYRPRDFVYLRHVFSNDGDLYIIDKNIENAHYPPFITIVRGQLTIFWGILTRKGVTSLIIDMDISNQGYLNDMQQLNLTMKYVQGLKTMELKMKDDVNQLLKYKLFDLSWDITKNQTNKINNQIRIRRKTQRMEIKKKEFIMNNKIVNKNNVSNINNQTVHKQQLKKEKQQKKNLDKKIAENVNSNEQSMIVARKDMQKVGQIDIKQIQNQQKQKTVQVIKRDFDANGHVIITKEWIKTKFRITPINNCKIDLQQPINGHPLWKGQWKRDQRQGGFVFINQKKINAQKDVLKFILSKIGKNLLSGKSILNISLPVDIFSAQSNLERLLYTMTYAPVLLQKTVEKNSLQRLKSVIAFGMSTSPTYLNMQKPFNPILGQTFSCWINGCPGYAQQISHHPPIGSLYFIGRGYKISAQLQSKVQLHMNSGTGINDGTYRVKYNDNLQICFNTPGGQVSGLTYGDRRFNLSGKAYYWIQKQNLLIQIVLNPAKKGFFSVGKQEQPQDYFEGMIYQVKPQFMDKFIVKRASPKEKQIVKQIGKIHGIWHQKIFFNQQILLDYDIQFPVKLQYQPYPLPSDANWREDIQYRRILQITRAQTQKQRLQILQRNDRKLRQAKSKKK